MTTSAILSDDHVRRLAEASAWRVSLSEAEQTTSAEFEAWLSRDLANETAWDEVQSSWTLIGEQASAPELLALRRAALGRAERHGAERWSRNAWLPRIAACLVLLLAGTLLYLTVGRDVPAGGRQPLVYATALGERRVVTLEDGSKISLDSASEVRILYSSDTRKLELKKGQARFDVAHDATRPFSVRAGDRTVVATGTAFNIDLVGSRVQITLIEGKVVIVPDKQKSPAGGSLAVKPKAIQLSAGQQFTETPVSIPTVEAVNLERATSWESGQLVFEDERLGTVVDRVGRYTAVKLRVAPAVADLRISGVFNSGDIAAFVDVVEQYLPVKGRRTEDGSILLTSS